MFVLSSYAGNAVFFCEFANDVKNRGNSVNVYVRIQMVWLNVVTHYGFNLFAKFVFYLKEKILIF